MSVNTFGRTMVNLADMAALANTLPQEETFSLFYDGREFYVDVAPDEAFWIGDISHGDTAAFIAAFTDAIMTDIEAGLY